MSSDAQRPRLGGLDGLGPGELADAARQLRALVRAFPPASTVERATARRIEGAAVALDALSRAVS